MITAKDIPQGGFSRPLLLLGCSARLLAESGRRSGFHMKAVDAFLDEETLGSCSSALKFSSGSLERLDALEIVQIAARIDPEEQCGIVYGGGFEYQPDLLETLSVRRKLLGNAPGVLRRLMPSQEFFGLLDQLEIPYPEVRIETPKDPENWIIKSSCTAGGRGVRSTASGGLGLGEYYQRCIAGLSYSVLFVSDGRTPAVIGFNTQWSMRMGHRPFIFAGAANFTRLKSSTLEAVSNWLFPLIAATGLVGLNSLDFMVTEEGFPLMLEVNPRPSATMGLYDEDVPGGLLLAHFRAVQGRLPEGPGIRRAFRAFHVVLSPRAVRLGISRWPHWCHDRPRRGTKVGSGAPFCTIDAEGASPQQTLKTLKARMRSLHRTLMEVTPLNDLISLKPQFISP